MDYLSTREAAAYLGYSFHTMKNYLARGKIVPDIRIGERAGFTKATLDAFRASRRRGLTDEQIATARARFHGGETIYKVAADFGVHPDALHRKLGPRGFRISKLSEEEWARIKSRYLAGETMATLTSEYGVSPSEFYRRVGSRKSAQHAAHSAQQSEDGSSSVL